MNKTWNKLLEFETRDLVERFIQKKHNRKASARQILEITSNFIQAREYFINSKKSNISVKPLLQYYAVTSMARGLILATSPKLSESALQPHHGLETSNWQNSLTDKKFDELTVIIRNGTFYELLLATSNKSYFKNNSNGISWKFNFDIPKVGEKIRFIDLIQTISDLSDEYESWVEKKLYFFQMESFIPTSESIQYGYKLGKYLKGTDEVLNVFINENYDKFEIKGSNIITSNETHPQFSQRFYDIFNTGTGEIVLTKAIHKDLHINTLSQFYLLSYFMGMLARYFPSIWMSISRSQKGDAIYPLFIKAMEHIENHYPLTVLDFLSGPYDFEKKL